MSKSNQKIKINSDISLIIPDEPTNIVPIAVKGGKQPQSIVHPIASGNQRQISEAFRKPNYYKYANLRGSLIDMLDGNHTAAQIADALRITQQTLFKYKALAQLDSGLQLQTVEEKIHLEKNLKSGDV